MKNLFIGIDFSKKTFDVTIFERSRMDESSHLQFPNTPEGYKNLLVWVRTNTSVPSDQWLFCGEHTGLYGVALTEFLIKKDLFVWLEHPLQIKLSTGMKRGKSDKADSLAIAQYAYRFEDRAIRCRLTDKDIEALSLLFTFRTRLVRYKKGFHVSVREMRPVYKRNRTARQIKERSDRLVKLIDKEIKQVEKQMLEIISKSALLKENYDLVTSVKGIALINAVMMLIHTGNFTRFDTARQIACYTGVAPFGDTSGTSRKKRERISSLANKEMKALLTQAARCAVIHDPDLRSYYHRKLQQGKNERLVINNVRNKLVHRIFAVVKNKKPYQTEYQNMLSNTNMKNY